MKTPQQNGIVERKNRTIQEMARSMLLGHNVSRRFWTEAVSIACHTANRVYLRPHTLKTPYELWTGKKPSLAYFHVLGSKCYILRDREKLGKFDSQSDEGIFLGYSSNTREYRVFNLKSSKVMESINVTVQDDEPLTIIDPNLQCEGEDFSGSDLLVPHPHSVDPTPVLGDTPAWVRKSHDSSAIIGDPTLGVKNRAQLENVVSHLCYTSTV